MTEAIAAKRPSIIRRIAENFSTPRKALTTVGKAGGTGLLLGELAACGGAPATQTPNATGENTPMPTITTPGTMPSMSENPTPGITIKPTASASEKANPTPTEQPSPTQTLNMESIVTSKVETVTATQAKQAITDAYNTDKGMQAGGSLDDFVGKNSGWQNCQVSNGQATNPLLSRQESCGAFILAMYNNFKNSNNPATYEAALEVFDYAETTLPLPYKQQLIEYLTSNAK